MTENFNLSDWITTKQAAELTGYATAYFRQLIQRGRLPAQKLGRDWFLKKEDVLAYAAEMKQLGSEKYNPWRTGTRKRSEDERPAEGNAG
jgi:excisionase family DNA binding protein